MNIKIYDKGLLEQLWQEDRKHFMSDAETPPACLRCGKPLDNHLVLNALSRHADVYVCRECGTDEALRDAIGEPLPLRDWAAVTSGRIEQVVLAPFCTFGRIFEGPKKLFPLSCVEHPACEVAYSRSDYDGRKWWRTWFHGSEERLEPPFQDNAFPDKSTCNMMGKALPFAQVENADLMQAISHLSARERYILFARVLMECEYAELAKHLNLRYSSVSTAYHRIIKKLRKELQGGRK